MSFPCCDWGDPAMMLNDSTSNVTDFKVRKWLKRHSMCKQCQNTRWTTTWTVIVQHFHVFWDLVCTLFYVACHFQTAAGAQHSTVECSCTRWFVTELWGRRWGAFHSAVLYEDTDGGSPSCFRRWNVVGGRATFQRPLNGEAMRKLRDWKQYCSTVLKYVCENRSPELHRCRVGQAWGGALLAPCLRAEPPR